MQKRGSISLENIQDTQKISRLAKEVSPSIQLVLPSTPPEDLQLESASLVILSGDPNTVKGMLHAEGLPGTVPILYLGSADQFARLVTEMQPPWYIDNLPLPVSEEIFTHKLRLLTRVNRILLENQNQASSLNQQLEIFYNRDGLTGLYTRRHLTDQLQIILQSSIENGSQLSLLILNIDYFNNVNKCFGLEFGDFLLNAMSARLTDTTPGNATCYRFSGEDFVILLPETPLQEALGLAKKINQVCSEKPFWNGEHSVSITLSTGIASLQNHQPQNHTEFLCMAETALFGAKANGRNRTQIYTPPGEEQELSPHQTLGILEENLSRILERSRNSAIASLQLLTSNIAEDGHQEHIAMVSHYLELFANQLGLPDKYAQTFKNSIAIYSSFRCLLHRDIYTKPSKLSPEDRKAIEDLPFKLSELVDMFDYFAKERNILLSHCERYDGSGYPLGLEKDDIPLGARIFHILDALAAMNGNRPYRKKLTPRQIINELTNGAGKQFDPNLVIQIFRLIETHQLLEIDPSELQDKRQILFTQFPELTK